MDALGLEARHRVGPVAPPVEAVGVARAGRGPRDGRREDTVGAGRERDAPRRSRRDQVDLDRGADSFADPAASARSATAFGIGLNWYLNDNLRWALDYERTSFDGGAADGADRADEDALLMRVALGF